MILGPPGSLEAESFFPLNCLELRPKVRGVLQVPLFPGPPVSLEADALFPLNRLGHRPKVREALPISQSQQAPTHGFRFVRGVWGPQVSQFL